MAQQVREIMTGMPVTIGPDTPAVEVARLMREEDLGAVLVTIDGKPRALVTDRDLTVRILAEGGDVSAKSVQEACSDELFCVAPDDDIDRAIQLMRSKAIRRLPVIENGEAVGMVSLGDLAVERDPESALGGISAAQPNT